MQKIKDRCLNESPWSGASTNIPPSGLRDTILRIQYMSRARCHVTATAMQSSLLKSCARWRLYQPEQWKQLLSLMKIPEELTPISRPGRLKKWVA